MIYEGAFIFHPIVVFTIQKAKLIAFDEYWAAGMAEPGGKVGPTIFGRSVNSISTMGAGADYTPTLILAPPKFQTFHHPCWASKSKC